MVAPDFSGVEAVPGAWLAGTEQKIDAGQLTTAAVNPNIAIDLAEVAAFFVGNEFENADNIICSQISCHSACVTSEL